MKESIKCFSCKKKILIAADQIENTPCPNCKAKLRKESAKRKKQTEGED